MLADKAAPPAVKRGACAAPSIVDDVIQQARRGPPLTPEPVERNCAFGRRRASIQAGNAALRRLWRIGRAVYWAMERRWSQVLSRCWSRAARAERPYPGGG